ncbi:MAG: hypothetical protein AAF750_06990 [Planctomycetota bacterium]
MPFGVLARWAICLVLWAGAGLSLGDDAIELLHAPERMGRWSYTPVGQGSVVKVVVTGAVGVQRDGTFSTVWVDGPTERSRGVRLMVRSWGDKQGSYSVGNHSHPVSVAGVREGLEVKHRDRPVRREWLGRKTQLLESRYEEVRHGWRNVWRVYHHPDRQWLGRTVEFEPSRGGLWLDPSVVRVEKSVYRPGERRSRGQQLVELHPDPVMREVAGRQVACYLETVVSRFETRGGVGMNYERRWISAEVPGLLVHREVRSGRPDGPVGVVVEAVAFGPIEQLKKMDTRPVVVQERD